MTAVAPVLVWCMVSAALIALATPGLMVLARKVHELWADR